jgi:hypothetical protein
MVARAAHCIALHCIGFYTYYMYQLWYLSTYS